jgi:hypothetical protein
VRQGLIRLTTQQTCETKRARYHNGGGVFTDEK